MKILCRITNDRVGINADLLSRKILDNGTEDKSSSGNRKLINSRGKIGKRLTVGWIINIPSFVHKNFPPSSRPFSFFFFFHHRIERATVPILTFLPRNWNGERIFHREDPRNYVSFTFLVSPYLKWSNRFGVLFQSSTVSMFFLLSLSLSSFFFYNQGIKHEHSASPFLLYRFKRNNIGEQIGGDDRLNLPGDRRTFKRDKLSPSPSLRGDKVSTRLLRVFFPRSRTDCPSTTRLTNEPPSHPSILSFLHLLSQLTETAHP